MMQWLTLWFALQSGLFAQEMVIAPIGPLVSWATPQNTLEITMEMKAVLFEHVELGGFIRTYQISTGDIFFDPFRIDYGIHAAIFWGPFKVGIQHECDHQVWRIDQGFDPGRLYSGSTTELFIRFETKINF